MPNTPTSTTTIAAGSIAVGFVVLALKFGAYTLTGSIALLSDALESLVNIATAVAALAAIRYGAIPADANHPYGHHKAEYFSVVLEGVLIVIAAFAILREAYLGFQSPRALDQPAAGLAVTVLASLINGAWAYVLVRVGRRRRSPALVALLILWQGWRVARLSIGGLMDEAVPPETLARIHEIIKANATGAIQAHDFRTRAAGRMTFIEFHLVVAGTMPVSQSHDICDRIERALRAEVPDATITIHVEPEEKAKHEGVVQVGV